MPQRIAASLALIAFAMCLVVGSFHAHNTFGTVVMRALFAMTATFVIGLILGNMAQKMLMENLRQHEEKLKNSVPKVEPGDR